MRTCAQCGTANGDNAEFCGGCGAFLEWDEPVAGQSSHQSGAGVRQSTSAVGTAAVGTEPPQTGTAATERTADTRVDGGSTPDERTTDPGRNTTDPGVTGQAAQLGLVQPGEGIRRRRSTLPTVEEPAPLAPDEVPCPACRTGNDVSRRFCRRCGASLTAVATPRPSWWRRLLARLRVRRKRPVGYRPRTRGGGRRGFGRWLVLALVLAAVVAVAAIPDLRARVNHAYQAVRDRMAGIEQVTPIRATASSERPSPGGDYAARNAIDGARNSYWSPNVPAAQAPGQWITLDLAHPVRLAALVFTTGVSTNRPEFLAQARPENIDVTLTAADGTSQVRPVRLQDKTGEQRVLLDRQNVSRIQVTVKSVYGAEPGRLLAIAEVEVFVHG